MTSSVSVLICTYNRHQLLQQALQALLDETTEKPDEVVVVNGGDEQADAVVQQFIGKNEVELKLIKTVNVNLATSRNIGLEHCTGDLVALTDDDAEVFPDWITRVKSIHAQHPEAGVIGGAVIGADSHHDLLSRLSDLVTFPQPDKPAYVRTVPGVNATYKREALDKVGQQDVTLARGEDVDFNWRIKQLGYEVLFHPDMRVLHHHRPALGQFFRQHFMYGRSYYRVRQKWQEMYCVYPHKFQRVKDYLKALYFLVAIVYQPIRDAMTLESWMDRLRAIPILMINHALWKCGMLYERWLYLRQSHT